MIDAATVPMVDTAATLGVAFDKVIEALRDQAPAVGLPLAQHWQDRLAGVEAELMARTRGANRHTKRRLAGAASTRSTREADRRYRRADAVTENPQLGDAVASGDLGAEQLDAIAEAAAKSDGAAATDQGLVDEIKTANPDQAREIARRWVDDHTSNNQRESTHRRPGGSFAKGETPRNPKGSR